MKTNYLESAPGNKSSSRVFVLIIICVALIYVGLILWLGRADIVPAATAAGVLFITIGGPAMAFMFGQKRTENKPNTPTP